MSNSINAQSYNFIPYLSENNYLGSNSSNSHSLISLEGSLISSIYQGSKLLVIEKSNSSQIHQNKTIKNFSNVENHRNQSPSTVINDSSLLPLPLDNLSDIYPVHNNSDNLTNNLVSMLSGIIIDSIENGNPTLSSKTEPNSNKTNNFNPFIIVGKWKLDIINGNPSFQSKFLINTFNGTDLHWHYINNFKTNQTIFLGNNENAVANGKMDFFTENNITKKTTQVLLTINNLESIQIVMLDNDVARFFNNLPLYGTIDSIKVNN